MIFITETPQRQNGPIVFQMRRSMDLEFIRACDVISLAGHFQGSHLECDDVRSP
jgi:hypothetical protein